MLLLASIYYLGINPNQQNHKISILEHISEDLLLVGNVTEQNNRGPTHKYSLVYS